MDRRRAEAFEVLGIPVDSDHQTVVRAFRRLAHENHPDVSKDLDAADRFARVAAAYELISHLPPRVVAPAPEPAREPAPRAWTSRGTPPIVAGPVRFEPWSRDDGRRRRGV